MCWASPLLFNKIYHLCHFKTSCAYACQLLSRGFFFFFFDSNLKLLESKRNLIYMDFTIRRFDKLTYEKKQIRSELPSSLPILGKRNCEYISKQGLLLFCLEHFLIGYHLEISKSHFGASGHCVS